MASIGPMIGSLLRKIMLKKILVKRLPKLWGQTLNKSDFEGNAYGLPGEWVYFATAKAPHQGVLGFFNPFQEQEVFGQLVGTGGEGPELVDLSSEANLKVDSEKFVLELLTKSLDLRLNVFSYLDNARIFYGHQDGLPGLIVDSYQNAVLIQINTAGVDRFRKTIKNFYQDKFGTQKQIILLDAKKARSREQLPAFEEDEKNDVPEFLIVNEGILQLKIHYKKLQKLGYYYDHRDNRVRLYRKLTELKLDMNLGLDLFCYHGAWGITLLKAGMDRVHFVDQGSLGEAVYQNLILNNLPKKGDFFEQDAFKFLDQQIEQGTTYQVIVSDPPSFTKSAQKIQQSLSGYRNLHFKVLSCASSRSLVAFCSCTSYVTMEQFEESILWAAKQSKRSLRLVDVGLQALDHPVRTLNDKSNYLKYLAYIVE